MKSLIISQYDGCDLSFNENGWFNATQASSYFNKRPIDWLRLDETKNYIDAIGEHLEISEPKSLIQSKRNSGTWLHPKLAIAFARWLDVRFGVWCDLQIDQLLRGNHPIFEKRRLRHESTATYKAITAVLKLSREQLGKETKPFHYINEAKLINWAMFGQFTGLDRNSLAYDELDLLAELEIQDLVLIGSNYNYEQRKVTLKIFADNFKKNRKYFSDQINLKK